MPETCGHPKDVDWRSAVIRIVALVLVGCGLLFGASAVEARTNAGQLLWQDVFDRAGGQDVARAVAAGHGRVVVVGDTQNSAGNGDFLVRSYDASTGTLLWKDIVDVAGGDDVATAV